MTAIAIWDERREASAALSDFGTEQSALAREVAVSVAARTTPGTPVSNEEQVFGLIRGSTLPAETVVAISPPGAGTWSTASGGRIPVPADARDREDGWTRLTRDEAASLALPARTAVAGFAHFVAANGAWTVAVVTSAERERDRENRAQLRLVLGVLVAASLVLAFGGVALRKQKRALDLAHDLDVAEMQRELDQRLVRADKLATMGALAIGVAHEIATPLGVIVGRTEQTKQLHDFDRIRRNGSVVLEQCERIDRVVRGMLALARGDRPVLERVRPEGVARRATELVAHRFVSARVTLAVETGKDLPLIACEPRLFEQALANLLLNACDACESGTGHVELRVEGDSFRVAFVVSDNGKGIPKESMARVLEPFFTTKTPGKGAGLGLSIANEIVRHSSGTLTIAPARRTTEGPKRGTRACIELPAVPEAT